MLVKVLVCVYAFLVGVQILSLLLEIWDVNHNRSLGSLIVRLRLHWLQRFSRRWGEYVSSAYLDLQMARESAEKLKQGVPESFLSHHQRWINDALSWGWWYRDIGIRKKELQRLLAGESIMREAQREIPEMLEIARRNPKFRTMGIHARLRDTNLTPEDFGTSYEELNALNRLGGVIRKREWLDTLRRYAEGQVHEEYGSPTVPSWLKDRITEPHKEYPYPPLVIPLREIGTSAEELDRLVQKADLHYEAAEEEIERKFALDEEALRNAPDE